MMTYDALSERIQSINKEIQMRTITVEMVEDLLKEARNLHHIGAQIHLLVAKGYLYYFSGEIKQTYELMFSALSLANQIKDAGALIRVQFALGSIYAILGLYEHGLHYFMLALETAQKNKFEEELGKLYLNIGAGLFKAEMVEEAGKYCRLAYEHFKNKENPYTRFFSTMNMAVYAMRINQLEEAENYLKETDAYIDQIPASLRFSLKSNYARLYAYQDNFEKSMEKMNKIYGEYFKENVEITLYDQIIEWCYILQNKNKLFLAKNILKQSIENIKDEESVIVGDLLMLLADIYEKEEKYKKALKLYKKSVSIKSSLYRKNQQFITYNTLKLMDISKTNRELVNKSHRDALTGCFNRHALVSDGQAIIDKTYKSKQKLAIIMFDIDYFKQYNDHYGHLEGDHCIKNISDAIQKIIPEEQRFFFRYGGDEFLILWPIQKLSGKEIAKMMLAAIRELKLSHKKSPVADIATISIGISTSAEHNQTLQNGIDAADLNLYKAKFNKRNSACVDEVLIQ